MADKTARPAGPAWFAYRAGALIRPRLELPYWHANELDPNPSLDLHRARDLRGWAVGLSFEELFPRTIRRLEARTDWIAEANPELPTAELLERVTLDEPFLQRRRDEARTTPRKVWDIFSVLTGRSLDGGSVMDARQAGARRRAYLQQEPRARRLLRYDRCLNDLQPLPRRRFDEEIRRLRKTGPLGEALLVLPLRTYTLTKNFDRLLSKIDAPSPSAVAAVIAFAEPVRTAFAHLRGLRAAELLFGRLWRGFVAQLDEHRGARLELETTLRPPQAAARRAAAAVISA